MGIFGPGRPGPKAGILKFWPARARAKGQIFQKRSALSPLFTSIVLGWCHSAYINKTLTNHLLKTAAISLTINSVGHLKHCEVLFFSCEVLCFICEINSIVKAVFESFIGVISHLVVDRGNRLTDSTSRCCYSNKSCTP